MRREQTEKALISLLSSLLILISFTIQTQARSLLQACPPSSCGDIQNISYPFRLKSEPANCGDPDYELSCENNQTIMEFHSGRYYVKEISYRMRTIRLVDANFANGTCNLPHNSLSSYEIENDIRYQGRNVYIFASFLNCSTTIIGDPSYRKLPCVGGNTSQVYVTVDFYWQTLNNMPVGCSFLSGIPVDGVYEITHDTYAALFQFLQSGFELGWSVDCRNCRLLNKTCVLSAYESPLIYSCYIKGFELGWVECRNCHLLNKTCVVSAYKSPLNYSCYNSDNLVSTIAKIDFSIVFALFLAISLIARFILAPVVVIVFLLHKFWKERKQVDNVETFLRNQQSLMPKRYSYADLVAVTNHFKDKLGKGGFGSVYKGQLPGGILIAVKMLENTKFTAEEFSNEVSTIGRIHHVNVVQLLGFCSEGSNRALVYEYMPNGSLDKHIFSNNGKAQSFSWEKLLEIALGTARGIEYLHGGCDVCILYFNIKPHNVLLDRSFIPKVADFGLAKFFPKEKDFLSVSTMRRTIGYISPELISRHFGAVSSTSDVYSFGMLLLEMAGGRKNVDTKAKSSSKVYFPSWVYNHLVEGRGDLELKNVNEIDVETARKMCIVGLWCIQMKPSDRPSMTKVVEMLEGSLEALKMPPRPFLCSPPRSPMKEPHLDASKSG